MTRAFLYAAGLIACVAASSASAACGTGKVQYNDTFDKLDTKLWGEADKWMSVKGGNLMLTESDGNFYRTWAERTFRDVDFCSNMVLTEGTDLVTAYAGLIFWLRSADDFYTLQITLDGYADVYHYKDGDWMALIDDREESSIKQGLNSVNELRVVTHGGTATFYINGTQFDSINEKTSPGTWMVGFMVDAPKDGKATVTFDRAEVRDPVRN